MHDSFLSPLSPAPTAATLSSIGYIPAARCGMDHETCLVGAQGVVAPQGIDTRLPKGVNAPQSVFGKGCPRPPLLTLYMPGITTLNPLVIQAPVLTYAPTRLRISSPTPAKPRCDLTCSEHFKIPSRKIPSP